jgi:hypothetical protein
MRRAGAAFIAGMRRIYLSVYLMVMYIRWHLTLSMDDPVELVDTGAGKHAFHWDTAAQLPTVPGINALRSAEAKNAKIKEILADLSWRMHDAVDLKKEIERLRTLNVAILSRVPAPEAPAAQAAPAAPGGDAAVRIKELEGQLQAANETNRIQKEAWDAEKEVFAVSRAAASAPASTVVVPAVAGGTDEVKALNDEIEQQHVDIEYLTDQVHQLRELHESRASSTTSNTLHDLLLKLQRVLRLPFEDPDAVYEAVAEAIYAHTTSAQRSELSNKPDKVGFIEDLINFFHRAPSDATDSYASESDSDEADTAESDTAEAARSARTPRADRPESARAKKETENQGYARRAFKSVVNKLKGMRGDSKTDMSTLLSDLKHASEHGSSFTNNICSVDAELPPT